jgi:ERCC4-type nuclease
MMRGRGGASFGRTTGTTATSSSKTMTAKCPENQEGLDRLMQVRIKAELNPNSNLIFSIKRAMKSLQECKTPILTLAEANKLKYVGPKLARIICPFTDTEPPSPPSIATTAKAPSRKLKQTPATLKTTKKSEPDGPSKKQKAYDQAKTTADNLVLPCAPWKVVLIVDGREPKSQHIVAKCQQSGIPCEERHLPIGDMAWIAQCQTKDRGVIEVMCGTILERKDTQDLASSLFGTRYLEQRLRLQNCGLPQVLFLVEGDLNACANCPGDTLQMAMMETRVQLGFQIVQTKHMQDTVRLLKGLHRRIVQRTFPSVFGKEAAVAGQLPAYSAELSQATRKHRRERRPTSLLELVFDTPPVPAFGKSRFITYEELKAKVERDREAGTKTMGALYLAMLKQVPTLSHKKCNAIAQHYPTMNALMNAYQETDHPRTLVQDIKCESQKVGPKSSIELFVACCTQRDGSLPDTEEADNDKKPAAKKAETEEGNEKKPPAKKAPLTTIIATPTAATMKVPPTAATIIATPTAATMKVPPTAATIIATPTARTIIDLTQAATIKVPPTAATIIATPTAVTIIDLTQATSIKVPPTAATIIATPTAVTIIDLTQATSIKPKAKPSRVLVDLTQD